MDACEGLEFATIEKVAVERVTVTGPWAWDVRLNQLSPGSFHPVAFTVNCKFSGHPI